MSNRQDKKMRRIVRKVAGHAYEKAFLAQGEHAAKQQIIAAAIRDKPKWLPASIWDRVINRVLWPPDKIMMRGTPTINIQDKK